MISTLALVPTTDANRFQYDLGSKKVKDAAKATGIPEKTLRNLYMEGVIAGWRGSAKGTLRLAVRSLIWLQEQLAAGDISLRDYSKSPFVKAAEVEG